MSLTLWPFELKWAPVVLDVLLVFTYPLCSVNLSLNRSSSQSTWWVDQICFLQHQNSTWNTWDKNFEWGTAQPSYTVWVWHCLKLPSQSTRWVDQICLLRHQNPTWNTRDKIGYRMKEKQKKKTEKVTCRSRAYYVSAGQKWNFFTKRLNLPPRMIFSCDEQLKKWRCHSVRSSFRPLFFVQRLRSKPWTYKSKFILSFCIQFSRHPIGELPGFW